MVYRDNLVCAIKTGGQILREIDGTVTLPFGSEYAVLVKNLNSVRMQVSVAIDGKDATDGTRLIIGPNSSIELERFIRNGNLNEGNRLKFIERTSEVEQHRGVKIDDGIVRVEAWMELVQPVINVPIVHYYDEYRPSPWYPSFYAYPRPHTAGITVPGSVSNQQFHSTLGFPIEEQSRVVVLRLRGMVGSQVVTAPVTVAYKPTCVTCGRHNKADSKFCTGCGTALVLI